MNFSLKRVSFKDKLVFTKHLATMINAGIPISEALETLNTQTKSKEFKQIIEKILKDVENGQDLSNALSKHKKVFDNFYISLVEVGEESGTLEKNLEFLSGQINKDYRLRKKIQGAMFYPIMVLTATLIMGVVITFFVLPKLTTFFTTLDIKLPITTRILIFIADTAQSYGIVLLIITILIAIGLRFAYQKPAVKLKFHILVLKIPIIKELIIDSQISRFSRNLGTLIKSGVPMNKALEVTADTLSNLKFRKDLLQVQEALTKGKEIGKTMQSKDYWEFPPLVTKMIEVGEKAGKIDETLLYLGEFYDEEVDDIAKNLSTIIEPILLLTIGLMVAFLALAIITPIYQLTGSIRR
jgi:type IV pilus assembly protein PilC